MDASTLKNSTLADLEALRASVAGFLASTAAAANDLSTACQIQRRQNNPTHPDCARYEELRARLGKLRGDLEAIDREIARRKRGGGGGRKTTAPSPADAPEDSQTPQDAPEGGEDSLTPWIVAGAVLGGVGLALTRRW